MPKLEKLGIGFVDIDIPKHKKLARDHKISGGLPLYDICYKSTQKKLHTGHIRGYRSAENFAKLIDEYLSKITKKASASRTIQAKIEDIELPDILKNAIDHPDTIWTTREKHPSLQHTDHDVYRVGYNMAAQKHLSKTGSPNNEKPWRFSGGCDAFADQLDGEVCYYFPSKVRVWKERHRVPGFKADSGLATRWVGEYPIGSVGAEFLSTKGQLHAIRYRTKSADGWYGEQIDISTMPSGYVAVDNCVSCHSDIGRHANEIDNKQEWYTHVRGFEKDGFFNSPFMKLHGSGFGSEDFSWDNTHLLDLP